MKIYTFKRKGTEWFIDLPAYISYGGRPEDLQMIEGADEMLDKYAGYHSEIQLKIDLHFFPGADELTLTQISDDAAGGAYYKMISFKGTTIEKQIWLCDILKFIYHQIPEKIFVAPANTSR